MFTSWRWFVARGLRTGSSPVVGALFAAIFAAQLVESGAPLFVLYFIPIVLAARSTHPQLGLVAGGLAIVLVAVGALVTSIDLDALDYLCWVTAFLVVGWLSKADAERTVGTGPAGSPAPRVDSARGSSRSNDPGLWRGEILKIAGLGIWEADLQTGRVDWSDGYHHLFGVDPDSFPSSRDAFRQLAHPEDREKLTGALDRIIRDGVAAEVRYRIIRLNDGAERCLRSHIHSERDSAGKVIRLVGTAQDITDLVLVLSPREREILMLLAEGLSGDEIAGHLVLSPATVRSHIQNAMVKLGAHTRGEAIAKALRSDEIGS